MQPGQDQDEGKKGKRILKIDNKEKKKDEEKKKKVISLKKK